MSGTATTVQFLTDIKRDLTPTTVTIDTGSTTNAYGERTFTGSTTSYDAYVTEMTNVIRNNRDEEIIADYVAYIPSQSLTLTVNDQIDMPTVGVRPIVKVQYRTTPGGQQAVVAYVGGG